MREHNIVPDLVNSTEEEGGTAYQCSNCKAKNPDPDSECPAEGM